MSDNPIGKDGGERNFARIKKGYKVWRRGTAEHFTRFLRSPWDSHAYFNVWVEGDKLDDDDAAFFTGHLLGALVPIWIVTLALLVWRW